MVMQTSGWGQQVLLDQDIRSDPNGWEYQSLVGQSWGLKTFTSNRYRLTSNPAREQ